MAKSPMLSLWKNLTRSRNQKVRKIPRVWLRHTLRKSAVSITRRSFNLNPQDKRNTRRPKNTRRGKLESKVNVQGRTRKQLRKGQHVGSLGVYVMPPMEAEKTEEESYIMSFSSPVRVKDFLGRGWGIAIINHRDPDWWLGHSERTLNIRTL